jgi:glutaconate CoA-transferase, subunit B
MATDVATAEALMTAAAALEIADGDVCFVGIGVPSLAAMTARRCHAPRSVLIYESGAIDTNPAAPPLSTGSPVVVEDTAMIGSCLDVFAMLQSGRFDIGLLSAAQVDRHGNLNSTVIGPYATPKLRMVGSGGAHDIACLVRDVIIVMPHDPRRFVERVDFATSPGLRGASGASKEVLLRGRGPRCILTSRARFSFEAGEMTLDATFDGVSPAQATEGMRWQVPHSPRLRRLPSFPDALMETARRLVEKQPKHSG